MMLSPEPCSRASVATLLSLPAIRRRRWRRWASLLLREAMLTLLSLCQVRPTRLPPTPALPPPPAPPLPPATGAQTTNTHSTCWVSSLVLDLLLCPPPVSGVVLLGPLFPSAPPWVGVPGPQHAPQEQGGQPARPAPQRNAYGRRQSGRRPAVPPGGAGPGVLAYLLSQVHPPSPRLSPVSGKDYLCL